MKPWAHKKSYSARDLIQDSLFTPRISSDPFTTPRVKNGPLIIRPICHKRITSKWHQKQTVASSSIGLYEKIDSLYSSRHLKTPSFQGSLPKISQRPKLRKLDLIPPERSEFSHLKKKMQFQIEKLIKKRGKKADDSQNFSFGNA